MGFGPLQRKDGHASSTMLKGLNDSTRRIRIATHVLPYSENFQY
jgi:hypothetical protein